MAFHFGFFSDAALTTPISAPLLFNQVAGASVPDDKVVYYGGTTGYQVKAKSDPGVDQITVSVVDAAGGSGSPAADVKLALTAGGLPGATGGAALNLGTVINGGAGNAVAVYIRVTDSTAVTGLNTDLSLTTNALYQY